MAVGSMPRIRATSAGAAVDDCDRAPVTPITAVA